MGCAFGQEGTQGKVTKALDGCNTERIVEVSAVSSELQPLGNSVIGKTEVDKEGVATTSPSNEQKKKSNFLKMTTKFGLAWSLAYYCSYAGLQIVDYSQVYYLPSVPGSEFVCNAGLLLGFAGQIGCYAMPALYLFWAMKQL